MNKFGAATAILVYIVYNSIIFLTWHWVGANYTDLVSPGRAFDGLVLPLSLGASFIVLTVTAFGLWGELFEWLPGPKSWPIIPFVLCACGVMTENLTHSALDRLAIQHIAFLILAGILVGFNEETLNRGILVAGLRRSFKRERWVYLGSTALFGAMHVPNSIFGLPFYVALAQGLCAFLLGSGLYVLRRVSGTLLAPILFHGLWDFTAFVSKATGGGSPVTVVFQLGTYLLGLLAVPILFWTSRRDRLISEARDQHSAGKIVAPDQPIVGRRGVVAEKPE